jgi:hypothetical protein
MIGTTIQGLNLQPTLREKVLALIKAKPSKTGFVFLLTSFMLDKKWHDAAAGLLPTNKIKPEVVLRIKPKRKGQSHQGGKKRLHRS